MVANLKKTPHILMLAPLFPPFRGAAASRLFSLARYWRKHTRVTVISCQQPLQQEGIRQIKFPVTFAGYDFLRIPFLFSRLLRITRSLDVDLIFASIPAPWPLLEGYLLSCRLGLPLVADVRDLPSATYPVDKGVIAVRVYNALRRSVSMYFLNKAERMVTVTQLFKEEILKALNYSSNKLHIIGNGSEVDLYDQALGVEKEFDLVYSGTLIPVRNPGVMLKFLKKLAHLYSSLKVLFISDLDSSLGREFIRDLKRLDLMRHVVFKKMVSPSELPSLLGKAKVGWTSLRDGEYYFRGVISAKNYEYLAAGLPIMGLLDPDYYVEARRLIADNQVGILDPDLCSLARKTADLLKDKVRLNRMSRRARKVGERFDRKRLAEEYYYKVILPAWEEFNANRLGGR